MVGGPVALCPKKWYFGEARPFYLRGVSDLVPVTGGEHGPPFWTPPPPAAVYDPAPACGSFCRDPDSPPPPPQGEAPA